MEVTKRERHPIEVVYIRRISSNPGSSALRASTTGLCKTDPCRVPLRDCQARSAGKATPRLALQAGWTSLADPRCLLRCPTRPIRQRDRQHVAPR